MQVNKAEDIAGCRCIMTNTENVYKLFDKLQKIMDRLSFEITGVVHDYIEKPKDSGYRSIHLNVRLKGDKRVALHLLCDEDSSLISLYTGADTSDADAEAMVAKVSAEFPMVEVELQKGGQPVYFYVLSVE